MNKHTQYGILYLIPAPLGECALNSVISIEAQTKIARLDFFIAENAKTARTYLKKMRLNKPIQEVSIAELNQHTPKSDINRFITPLLQNHDVGLLSEAGCPGIADPGAEIVKLAHEKKIRVVPLVGPSSILLALMASGLNGQCFAFQGYLPIEEKQRALKLKELETQSKKLNQTQIFIETPYRNNSMLHSLIQYCHSETKLCIATDITLSNESIVTATINQWRQHLPNLDKRPSVFLMLG